MHCADAFARLYERESDSTLMFLARRTLDAETAVELTAETFAIALDAWPTLAPLAPEQARAWLFTVARRRYGRYIRRARVERTVVERLGMQIPAVESSDIRAIDEWAGLGELRRVVARELDRLPVEIGRAVRLRVVEERPYAEVARELAVSEATARARVSRGLRRLASVIEPYRNHPTEAVL